MHSFRDDGLGFKAFGVGVYGFGLRIWVWDSGNFPGASWLEA